MQKALALEVARELRKSPEKVYAICQSFHDGLREFLRHPENCKGGIVIEKFLVFKIKDLKLEESLTKSEFNVELKQQILDNVKKYKRNEPVKKKQTKK